MSICFQIGQHISLSCPYCLIMKFFPLRDMLLTQLCQPQQYIEIKVWCYSNNRTPYQHVSNNATKVPHIAILTVIESLGATRYVTIFSSWRNTLRILHIHTYLQVDLVVDVEMVPVDRMGLTKLQDPQQYQPPWHVTPMVEAHPKHTRLRHSKWMLQGWINFAVNSIMKCWQWQPWLNTLLNLTQNVSCQLYVPFKYVCRMQ